MRIGIWVAVLLASIMLSGCGRLLVVNPIPPDIGTVNPNDLEGVWEMRDDAGGVHPTLLVTHTVGSEFEVQFDDTSASAIESEVFTVNITEENGTIYGSYIFDDIPAWGIAKLDLDIPTGELSVTMIDLGEAQDAVENNQLDGKTQGISASMTVVISDTGQTLLDHISSNSDFFEPEEFALLKRPPVLASNPYLSGVEQGEVEAVEAATPTSGTGGLTDRITLMRALAAALFLALSATVIIRGRKVQGGKANEHE